MFSFYKMYNLVHLPKCKIDKLPNALQVYYYIETVKILSVKDDQGTEPEYKNTHMHT